MKPGHEQSLAADRSVAPDPHHPRDLRAVPASNSTDVPTLTVESEVDVASQKYEDGRTSEPDFARVKDTYKEAVSMVKDTLDVAWKVAPLAFLPAALFLWVYLRSIHWTGIFQYSAMSGSGLIFLFAAAMLLAFAAVLQFVAPSLMLIGTLSHYRHDRTIPKAVPQLYRWAMGGWLLGLGIVIGFDSSQAWIVCALAFLGAFIFAVVRSDALGLQKKPGAWRLTTAFYAFCFAAVAMLTMCITSAPLLITLHVTARYVDGGWFENLLGFVVCLGTTVVSLLPGYMYLNARTWNPGIYRPIKLALLGSFFSCYIVITGAALFLPISATILRLAGVYSNEQQTFEVLQPNLAPALSAVGLSVSQDEKLTLVSGYVRYDFGGTRLLCRKPFDLASVSDGAVKAARKKKAPDPGIVAGSGCVQASSSELRPMRI
ncbi:MAG TPA: hypothetical protein VF534_09270 [Paraburkholderia sp.]